MIIFEKDQSASTTNKEESKDDMIMLQDNIQEDEEIICIEKKLLPIISKAPEPNFINALLTKALTLIKIVEFVEIDTNKNVEEIILAN